MLDVWLENLGKNLSLGRNPSIKLRYDIDHFKETVSIAKLDSPSSAKRIDLKLPLSRSPSPLSHNKKPEFIWNTSSNSNNNKTEPPPTIRTMDIDDSGPSSIIMPAPDVSSSNGINNFTSSTSSKTKNINNCNSSKQMQTQTSSSFDNNSCSHSSSFSSNDKIIDQVPSLTYENNSNNVSTTSSNNEPCSPFIREIPKSPHLSKDFGENGERLRNSLRFRRQERLQKQRSLRSLANLMSQQSSSQCSWDSGNENSISSANTDDFESDRGPNYFHFTNKSQYCDTNQIAKTIGKKPKPYGEKGFIIHVNDGLLTLNDVKDLNNCYSDDFDSSCDTSLNYIDPDSLNTTIEIENAPSPLPPPQIVVENKHFSSPKSFKNSSFEIAVPTNDAAPNDDKKCQYTDEVRENLIKCKSKLDALDISNKSPKMTKKSAKVKTKQTKVSLSDMLLPLPPVKRDHHHYNHHQFDVVVTKPPNISVFTRLHPPSSPNLNNNRSTNQKQSIDPPSKRAPPAKRNDAQNGTPKRNYSKNTLAFIEKISDGLIERHQKSGGGGGQASDKKGSGKNMMANSTTVQQKEVLTRKPPAPNAPKKSTVAMPTSATTRIVIDKQKKSNPSSQQSPTRKQRP